VQQPASEDVDGYLAGLPAEQREALAALRARIRALAPDAAESISYGMPTFKYRGRPLIYFGAAKRHLSVYGVEGGTYRFQPDSPPDDEQLRAWIEARKAVIDGSGPGR